MTPLTILASAIATSLLQIGSQSHALALINETSLNPVEISTGSLPPEDRCLQPAFRTGHCPGETQRTAWSFDPKVGHCKPFNYSGCGGDSDNVFCTKVECERRCEDFAKPDESFTLAMLALQKRQLAEFRLINHLCFKRYQILEDEAADCPFQKLTAWYYNRLKQECRSYRACAPEHIVYKRRSECEAKCRPLYEDINPYAKTVLRQKRLGRRGRSEDDLLEKLEREIEKEERDE